MSEWDWAPYLTGGGTRPDAMTGLAGGFEQSLRQLFMDAPPEIRDQLRVLSAYRSPEVQASLWENALEEYGSPEAARQWVAPPGNSRHNHGMAVDLRYLDPAAQEYVHANAERYGLHFPMEWEPWHIEPIGPDGQRAPIDGSWTPSARPGGPETSTGQADQRMNALAALQRFQPQTQALDPAAFQTRPRQRRNFLSTMPGAY